MMYVTQESARKKKVVNRIWKIVLNAIVGLFSSLFLHFIFYSFFSIYLFILFRQFATFSISIPFFFTFRAIFDVLFLPNTAGKSSLCTAYTLPTWAMSGVYLPYGVNRIDILCFLFIQRLKLLNGQKRSHWLEGISNSWRYSVKKKGHSWFKVS